MPRSLNVSYRMVVPSGFSVARRLGLLLAPILVALALGAVLTLHVGSHIEVNRTAVANAVKVSGLAHAALAAVERGEAAQAAHLASGETAALAVYESARASALALAAELKHLAVDGTRQQANADLFGAQATVRFELLQRAIDARARAPGTSPAAAGGSGAEIMERLRASTRDILAEEDAALSRRVEAAQRSEFALLLVAVAAGIAVVAIGSIGGSFAARRVRLVASARKAAEARAALLQRTIEHAQDGIAAFDADRRLSAFNERFVRLVGVPANQAKIGASAQALCQVAPLRDAPELVEALFGRPDPGGARARRVTVDGRSLEIWQARSVDGGLIVSCRELGLPRS